MKRTTQTEDGGFLRDDTPRISPTCEDCIHLRSRDERRCKAFPKIRGIPREIWRGFNDHREPFEGDRGIQYEQRSPQA